MDRISFIVFLIIVSLACQNNQQKTNYTSGEDLFRRYCLACHSAVSPEDLPKNIWAEVVLPRMSNFLGIYEQESRATLLETNFGGEIVNHKSIFPKSSLLTKEEWHTLKQYIINLAPSSITDSFSRNATSTDLFNPLLSKYKFVPPSTTLIHPTATDEIIVGDANTLSLNVFKNDFLSKSVKLPSPAVDLIETPSAYLVLCMGSFSPTDNPTGQLISISKANGKIKTLIDSLNRPVHMDLIYEEKEHTTQIILSEFGKWAGKLSLYSLNNGTFEHQIIDDATGPVNAYFYDINEDERMDIIALFAQGNERISAYLNNGNGTYTRKDLIHFSPTIGSSNMTLVDVNQDDKLDILYCAGDNADYGQILKNNHGIYVYTNEGPTEFKLDTFLPFHGAYKAITYDFDADDDLDIIGLSYFPDYQKDSTSVQFFENVNGDYVRQKILPNNLGRWMLMEPIDIDGDDDMDLLLGALTLENKSRPDLQNQWIEGGNGFMYLINTVNDH